MRTKDKQKTSKSAPRAPQERPRAPQDPTWETCLSKEREARRHMSVVEACKAKAEDLKVGWTAENKPNDHKTTKNN